VTQRQQHWSRWGDPAQASPLSESTRALVELAFGPLPDSSPVALGDVRLPSSALPPDAAADLRAVLGDARLRVDDEARVRHTRGKSTPDLLRIRSGDASDAPDAVGYPADHDEVAALLEVCTRHRVAVVPYGGGTSVVGGLTARRDGFAGVVAVDMSRLDRLLAVDTESRTAVLQAGIRGPSAEALLAEHGMTLGHYPQSFEYATIGGFAATRSSGQASAGYGRFDSTVVGLRVATPRGSWELGASAPATAAGPDLRQLVLGSEGAFGIVTEVSVRVRPRPQATSYEAWRFESFADGCAAMRAVAQAALHPTVLRLSDEVETALNLARPDRVGAPSSGGCVMVVGVEGGVAEVADRRARIGMLLGSLGGSALGDEHGEGWAAGRFHGGYLRDSLLDVGVLVETVETATYWSRLLDLYGAVRAALETALGVDGAPSVVACHVSHVYETGASLYFTVATRQVEDPLAQWRHAKVAASDAIVAAGGTITHHHAVGRDHRPWLVAEIGGLGVDVLRAVKDTVDPEGILNPGVLVP
jgi:alkyldihydroxyacetonephosphate synthase